MKKLFNDVYDYTMLRFLIVGVINTIVGIGIMFLLYNCFGCSYWLSSIANYVVGGIVSFFLNKFYTFKNKEKSLRQVFNFILTVAICYIISYGIAKPFASWMLGSYPLKIQENIAMCIGIGLYVVINYIMQRFYVFKK